jgi:GTPase SAR1 family protein
VGTKTDLRDDSETISRLRERGQKVLDKSQGVTLAQELGSEYFECLSLMQEGLTEIFDRAVEIAWGNKKPSKNKCSLM